MKVTQTLLAILVAISSCSQPDPSQSSAKKEGGSDPNRGDTIDPPVELSGGLGLTMQCSVMNREVPGATTSEIGCIVSNDDGSKFSGDMKDLKASINAKGLAQPIVATPQPVSGNSPISVSLRVDNLLPADAESIDLTGKFNDKPATLAATLKGRFALICDEDTTYYVRSEAPSTNLACTEQSPCSKISQAVALLPDVFNCGVTIKVAAGLHLGQPRKYLEQVKISGKQITDKGSLKIIGVAVSGNLFGSASPSPSSDADYAWIEPPTNLLAARDPISSRQLDREAISIRSFGTSVANVTISNIAIDGKEPATLANQNDPINFTQSRFESAIQADTSFIIVKNVKIQNLRSTAVKSLNSSRVHLQSTTIKASLAGVEAVDSFELSMAGNLNIQGPGGSGADDEPPFYSQVNSFGIKTIRTVFKTISSGTEFANLVVTGVRTGLWINQATVDLAQKSSLTVESVHTGLKLKDNAHWEWEPNLLPIPASGPLLQPKLELIKCAHTCIDLDNSNFTMTTEISDQNTAISDSKIRPRLTLKGVARMSPLADASARQLEEETPAFLHMGLIKADRSSNITTAFLENLWCDTPNASNTRSNGSTVAVFLSEGSKMLYRQIERSAEHGCIKSGTMVSHLARNPSSENLDMSGNMSDYKNITIQPYRLPSGSTGGYFLQSAQTYLLPVFSSPSIENTSHVSSTAGGDPLRIGVEGFKSINAVTVGGTTATIAKFDAASNELFIIPPPKSPTPSSSDYAVISITGESKSLAEPGMVTLSRRGIEYRNACPKNYFEIPANTALGTAKFCVMTFEAKNLNGRTVSSHADVPIVGISRDAAAERCASMSPYHRLISNSQWQSIAEFIVNPPQDNFWIYSNLGLGQGIPNGHSDANPNGPQAATDQTGSGKECFNTGNNDANNDGNCDAGRSQEPQARYFYDPGTDLWDIAGNVSEWVLDNFTHTGISGLDKYASQSLTGSSIFAPRSSFISPIGGSFGGFGFIKADATAGAYGIARGGSYLDGDKSGVFAADATLDPTMGYSHVGFRCVVTPPASVP